MIRLEDILAKVDKAPSGDNLDLIRRAYFLRQRTWTSFVASGEPYLTHPLEVSNVLAEMKMDAVTVAWGYCTT
jgi:GTP pyrophosphokinase